MTVEVTLRPSGKSFALEQGETILECALRAGLNLEHGCTNGSCGECMARVLSGEARDVRFRDFALTDTQKRDGYTLLCCATAVTDLEIEAAQATRVEDVPLQSHKARVTRIDALGEHMVSLQCRIQRGRVMRFLAGQHARLCVADLDPVERPIASCPCDGHELRFHVERGDDAFTQHVFTALKRSDKLQVDGPFGGFVLDEESRRGLLFIACDAGFAPIGSLLEHAISLELPQPMHLLWYAGAEHGHYLHNQCRAWADALDELTYTARVLDGAAPSPARDLEVVESPLLRAGGGLGSLDVYVAGPAAQVDAIGAELTQHGADPTRIFSDPS